MMPQDSNSTTPGLNDGGQSVFVAENAHYFELPAGRITPATAQRGCRISNSNANVANNNDQALLSRVHSLLFGGTGGNEYQNVRGLARPVSSTAAPYAMKSEKQEKQPSETSHLEAFQQK